MNLDQPVIVAAEGSHAHLPAKQRLSCVDHEARAEPPRTVQYYRADTTHPLRLYRLLPRQTPVRGVIGLCVVCCILGNARNRAELCRYTL